MKKSLLLLAAAILFSVPANAQLLNRLADKAAQAATRGVEKAVEKKTEEATQKATEKIFDSASDAIDKQVDKAADAVGQAATNATQAYTDALVESANALNVSVAELNAATDSLRKANEAAGIPTGAGAGGLMGAYLGLMGVGTPQYVDNGNEVSLLWDYISFNLNWTAKFKGDKCEKSTVTYTFQTPELATEFYREQIDGLDKKDAQKYSLNGKTVVEDNTEEYLDKDKVSIKASIQQLVLSMGGKLE